VVFAERLHERALAVSATAAAVAHGSCHADVVGGAAGKKLC
jgi:hypothetical protein